MRKLAYTLTEPSNAMAATERCPCQHGGVVYESVSPQHARFAFGNDGDQPDYVWTKYHSILATRNT